MLYGRSWTPPERMGLSEPWKRAEPRDAASRPRCAGAGVLPVSHNLAFGRIRRIPLALLSGARRAQRTSDATRRHCAAASQALSASAHAVPRLTSKGELDFHFFVAHTHFVSTGPTFVLDAEDLRRKPGVLPLENPHPRTDADIAPRTASQVSAPIGRILHHGNTDLGLTLVALEQSNPVAGAGVREATRAVQSVVATYQVWCWDMTYLPAVVIGP